MLTLLGLTDWLWFENPRFSDLEMRWTKYEPDEPITLKEISNLFDIRRALKARIDYVYVIRHLSVREVHNLITAIDFFSTVAGTKYINGTFDRENYNYYVNSNYVDVFNEMIYAGKLEEFFLTISRKVYMEQCSQHDDLYIFCDNIMEDFLCWEHLVDFAIKNLESPARIAIRNEYDTYKDIYVRSIKEIITAY